jgi:hypothetical protein
VGGSAGFPEFAPLRRLSQLAATSAARAQLAPSPSHQQAPRVSTAASPSLVDLAPRTGAPGAAASARAAASSTAPCGGGPWPQRPFPSAGGSDRDSPSPCPSGGGRNSRSRSLHPAATWPPHADGVVFPRDDSGRDPISPSPTAAAPHLCFTSVVVPSWSPGGGVSWPVPQRQRHPPGCDLHPHGGGASGCGAAP